MEKSKTYCVMPHIGMQIQHSGRLTVCNFNTLEFTNPAGNLIQVHKDRLHDSWNAKERQQIKHSLDHGIVHPQCHGCFDKEAAGLSSQRTKFNNAFGDLEPSATQPRVLVIKPGNVCNLACRMCTPEASSAWYPDAYKLSLRNREFTGSFHDYTRTFNNERDGFHPDNENFWQDLREWIPNTTFVDIYGGEPFLSTGLLKSLTWVADQGMAHNTALRLSTNLTVYNEQYLDMLSKYKSLRINLSIDSHVPDQLGYIRYPCDPDQILSNLQKFKDYFSTNKNVNLSITLTVTPFNIYNLDVIHRELSKYLQFDEFNYVHTPVKYDVRILPDAVKQLIVEKINKPKIADYLLQTVDPTGRIFKEFWNETHYLDSVRHQSFQSAFPEYYAILAPYAN